MADFIWRAVIWWIVSCRPSTTSQPDTIASVLDLDDDTRESFINQTVSDSQKYCSPRKTNLCEDNGRSFLYKCKFCSSCYCDEKCSIMGDCCPEVALRRKINLGEEFTCLAPMLSSDILIKKVVKHLMIARCPYYLSNSSQTLCQLEPPASERNLSRFQPVTSRNRSITYRNKFCASCHGERLADLVFWKPTFICNSFQSEALSSEDGMFEAIKQKKCNIQFEPRSKKDGRVCDFTISSKMINRCNETGLWMKYDRFIDLACRSYRHVYKNSYQNVFCYICNIDLAPFCVASFGGSRTSFPFSVVLNFNKNSLMSEREPQQDDEAEMDNKTCNEEFVFDTFKRKCLKLFCIPGKRLSGERCVSTFQEITGLTYSLAFKLIPKDIRITERFLTNEMDISDLILKPFHNEIYVFKLITYKIVMIANFPMICGKCNTRDSVITWLVYLLISVKTKANRDEVENLMMDTIRSFAEEENGTLFNVKFYDELENVLENPNINMFKPKSFLINSTGLVIPVKTNYLLIDKMKCTNCFKLSPFLLCPHIILRVNETEFIGRDDGLFLPEIEVRVEAGEYEISDEEIKICADNYINKTNRALYNRMMTKLNQDNYSKALVIVSIVSSALSLVFLTLTFVNYCIFPELRSLPGKNNMGLVATEFIAQCFFFFGVDKTSLGWGCVLLGALLHFFLLAAVLWMNVCSFHMYRTFGGLGSAKEQPSHNRTVAKYSGYTFGLAGAIVSLTMLISYFTSGGATFGYGGHVCYLSTPSSIGLYFALPVGLVIISNGTFFILTVRIFQNMPKIDGQVNTDRENVYIYLKLSTITGAHWVVGFLAEVLLTEVLHYAFVLLNGLHGAFIFFSFVCNRRVLAFWKKWLRKTENHSTTMATSSTQVNY